MGMSRESVVPPISRRRGTAACLDYCAQIADKGCFSQTSCHDRCTSLYVGGCTNEVEDVLACLPDWLNELCRPGYPTSGGCSWPMTALRLCGEETLEVCTDGGGSLIGDASCTASYTCGGAELGMDCSDQANCTCKLDGEVVGTCAMPFSGLDACTPAFSCCRPFWGL